MSFPSEQRAKGSVSTARFSSGWRHRFIRPRRTLRFTRDGKYFVALSLGIGFAAINTGNNLLFLVLGMLLTLIVASGILSELSLGGLTIKRQVPDRLFAGQPFLMGIALSNTKRHISSFSIEVEDCLEARPLEKKCYFLKLPPGRTHHTSYRHIVGRRGLYRFTGFKVSTKFPFALFRKTRQMVGTSEVVVFPAIFPVLPPGSQAADLGEQGAHRLSRQGEFYALKEYRHDDDPRSIHWRKSARLGRLVIRQNEDSIARHMAIFLDNHQVTELLAPQDLDRQEQLVSQAASLAAHYIRRGDTIRLVTRTISVPAGQGEVQLSRVLHALALLDFTTLDLPFTAPPRWQGECIFIGPVGTQARERSYARQQDGAAVDDNDEQLEQGLRGDGEKGDTPSDGGAGDKKSDRIFSASRQRRIG